MKICIQWGNSLYSFPKWKVLNPDGWGFRVALQSLRFDLLVGQISGLVTKNILIVPRPLSSSVSCAPSSGLGRYRVGSCSWPVSDGRPGFEGFLDRDMLVPWLLKSSVGCVRLECRPQAMSVRAALPSPAEFFYILFLT
jgi:hypothetical protein